jgi:O-acetyl-ADP-ribose deacetylase (regulator of RNase III)
MNKTFAGKHIGLPKIGAGLAGGDWKIIKSMIIDGFKDCKITVINYKKTKL